MAQKAIQIRPRLRFMPYAYSELLMTGMGREQTLFAPAKITAPTLLRPRHEISSSEHRIGELLSKLSHLLIKYY